MRELLMQRSLGHYEFFRILFGLYLCLHFLQLLPWGTELFSSAGMVEDAAVSPLLRVFPNVLGLWDNTEFVAFFIGSGALAAVAFATGRHDRWAALWCWYVLACLFGRNPMIQNPSLPYVGWMLLAHLFIPAVRHNQQSIPETVRQAAWIVMSLAYSYSGYTKLLSTSWRDGSMLGYVLQNPLARDGGLNSWILGQPAELLALLTWGILWLEVLFAPLALSRTLRPWIWGGMLAVQLGFALLLNFADLTCAMLLFHLFTWDPRWLRVGETRTKGCNAQRLALTASPARNVVTRKSENG